MPTFNPKEIIPSAYIGREQAYIKHLLLAGYLERLLYIIGWNASKLGHSEVIYVDCFAGPWQDDSEDLSATSIGISLELLSKIQTDLRLAGRNVNFKAIYVEKDQKAFSRLTTYLATNSPENVSTESIRGDFCQLIPQIAEKCAGDSFAFFFIDPKGWSTVKPSVLDVLLKRPRSEFLINFMYDFINRTVTMTQLRSEITALFDRSIDIKELPAEAAFREIKIIEMYRSAIVARANSDRYKALSGYVTILDPLKDRTKYHLVYLTRHPLGIIKFMEQSEKLHPIQTTVRAAAKLNMKSERSGITDMFGVNTDQESENNKSTSEIENYWLKLFEKGPVVISQEVIADALSLTNAFPSDIQRAFGSLLKAGKIQNLDADISKRKTKFCDYEKKERWSLVSS